MSAVGRAARSAVRDARDGADRAAFMELVECHGPMVVGVCWEVLGKVLRGKRNLPNN